jgi:hypothetical protein
VPELPEGREPSESSHPHKSAYITYVDVPGCHRSSPAEVRGPPTCSWYGISYRSIDDYRYADTCRYADMPAGSGQSWWHRGTVLTNRYADMPICRYAECFRGVERLRAVLMTHRYAYAGAECFAGVEAGAVLTPTDMPICRYAEVFRGVEASSVTTHRYADMPICRCREARVQRG